MIEYNMQFFAEEVTSEADATEGDDVQMDPVEQEPANEEIKQVDMNRIFADARRRAEAQQKQKQNAIDKKYAERFGNNGIINPETGKPIMSASEYLDAVAAQERVAAQEELRDKGVDPAIIDRMVEASPVMKQAQAVLSENMAMRTQAKVPLTRKLEVPQILWHRIILKMCTGMQKQRRYHLQMHTRL